MEGLTFWEALFTSGTLENGILSFGGGLVLFATFSILLSKQAKHTKDGFKEIDKKMDDGFEKVDTKIDSLNEKLVLHQRSHAAFEARTNQRLDYLERK